MDILSEYVQDDGQVSFELGGLAADGLYRIVTLERDAVSAADWLAAHQAEAQSLIDAGTYNEELAQHLDLKALGQQVASELAYLNTTITGIDGYTAAQVRDVVKRLCQENRAVLLALRYVVKRLA